MGSAGCDAFGAVTELSPRLALERYVSSVLRVYVFTDATGSWPVLWRERRPPRESRGRRWQLVAQVEDEREARALFERLRGDWARKGPARTRSSRTDR